MAMLNMSEISPQNSSFSGCWPAVPQSHSRSWGPGLVIMVELGGSRGRVSRCSVQCQGHCPPITWAWNARGCYGHNQK